MLTLAKIRHVFAPGQFLFEALTAHVAAGDGILILGENGVGKTTLLRIMAGLLRPTQGRLAWQPAPRLGVVMNRSYLYPDLTGRENLAFYSRLLPSPCGGSELPLTPTLDRAATDWGLSHFWDQPVRELSRGQQQRLSLARATLAQPNALILDEPQSALDAEGLGLLEAWLADYQSGGGIVCVASHEPEVFRKICNREWRIHRQARVEGA